jgi:D-alanine-D-alanine ligase
LKVAVAYSAQRTTPDADLHGPVTCLCDALAVLGHEAVPVAFGWDAVEFLARLREVAADVVWNLCEEASGRADREVHAAALVELVDRPVTGNSATALALCQDKLHCGRALAGCGVAVPEAVRVRHAQELPVDLPLPGIVKPAREDGSAGIDRDSVCATREQVAAAVARLETRRLLPVAVERFIQGRELNVLLLGRAGVEPEHVAVGEISFRDAPAGMPHILTWAGKWDEASDEFVRTPSVYPADVEPGLRQRVVAIGTRAWLGLGLAGYARLDLRIDATGQPWVIDVNGNPDLSPGSGLQRALPSLGLRFTDFVALQLRWAEVR